MVEQLTNPSFVLDADGNPDGWIVNETDPNQVGYSSSGFLQFNALGGPSGGSIEQEVTNLQVGQTATLSFLVYASGFEAEANSAIKLEILDANGDAVVFDEPLPTGATYDSDGSLVLKAQFATQSVTFTTTSPTYTVRFTDVSTGDISVSDTYLGQLSFDAQEAPIINCFAKGTKILTPTGERNIEDLCAGDAVQTVDNEVQHIRWVGKSVLCSEQLRAFPNLCPIKISAGALGKNSPTRDLTVSPQHRILVRSKIAERMFGTAEVLIPAIKLVELSGISQVLDADGIEYYHMLFDKHEIVISEGAETESLYTGKQALMAIGPEAYEEVTTLFPEIADPDYVPHAARTIPQGKKMKELTARHVKNNKPLVSAF